jgi:hypothetical protein
MAIQGFPDTSGGPYLFDASFSSALDSLFFSCLDRAVPFLSEWCVSCIKVKKVRK